MILTSRFLKRKLREYEALKAEIEGLQAEAGLTEPKLHKFEQAATHPNPN